MPPFERGQSIVFEGDSLTYLRTQPALDQWPWLRISNNHRSWADVFSELLFAWRPELELKFRNAAVGGSTCRDLMNRLVPVVGKLKPDWVFMTLATNDATREVPVEEFESSLRNYAETIGAWGGKLVFLTGYAAYQNPDARSLEHAELRKPYFAVQAQLAEALENVYVIDLHPGLSRKAEALYAQFEGHSIYSDGTHFSNLAVTMESSGSYRGNLTAPFIVRHPLEIPTGIPRDSSSEIYSSSHPATPPSTASLRLRCDAHRGRGASSLRNREQRVMSLSLSCLALGWSRLREAATG